MMSWILERLDADYELFRGLGVFSFALELSCLAATFPSAGCVGVEVIDTSQTESLDRLVSFYRARTCWIRMSMLVLQAE